MNVVVIGLGSMGKRRIRILKELYPSYMIFGVDGREDRRMESEEIFGIVCYGSIQQVKECESVDAALICTSPLSHHTIIKDCLNNGWNVFTELNLVSDGYEENIKLAKRNGCKLFLSSTFLFREETCYIQKKVSANSKWNYIYHIGQYLPDWHPWESYQDFFIGNKRTNGCREIMAIELPWLIVSFGNVKKYQVMSSKNTNLHIDYHDNYMIQLEHENGNKGALIVDVVSPVAVRRLEAYSENQYIQWNGTPDSLMEYDRESGELVPVHLNETEEHKEGYRKFIVENAYKNEIVDFLEVLNNGKTPKYSFEKDLEILCLIDKIEDNIK